MAPPHYRKLSLSVQTTYARLLDLALTVEGGSPVDGGLVSKVIRGRRYWYAQRLEGGKKIQSYIGPETPEVTAIVERWRRAKREAASRIELVAMARAGGAYVVRAAEAEVLTRLAGFFRVGGVLVGSQAFAAIGNMLGVRWQDAIVRTDDVDIAHDYRIAVALARDVGPQPIAAALGDPIPRRTILNPDHPATAFRIRGGEIEVELLTPLVGRDRGKPIPLAVLGAAATPLRFLDYLIEDTQPGMVLGGAGVLVNLPGPGRFALHKLIVGARRGGGGSRTTKAAKDRAQAAALLSVLLEELPGEITLAWKALVQRGRAWRTAAMESMRRLDPELVRALTDLGVGEK